MSRIKIRPLTVLLLVGFIVLAVIGVVYLTDTAAHLPSFFPGHTAGSAKRSISIPTLMPPVEPAMEVAFRRTMERLDPHFSFNVVEMPARFAEMAPAVQGSPPAQIPRHILSRAGCIVNGRAKYFPGRD